MNGTEQLVTNVIVVLAVVLYLAMIFKIFTIAKDVRKLKNKLAPEQFVFEIRKNIALGNKEKAKQLLLDRFFTDFADDFGTAKKQLENGFKKLGEELPEQLKAMNSSEDFKDLF